MQCTVVIEKLKYLMYHQHSLLMYSQSGYFAEKKWQMNDDLLIVLDINVILKQEKKREIEIDFVCSILNLAR